MNKSKSLTEVSSNRDHFNQMKVSITSIIFVMLVWISSPVFAQWEYEVIDPDGWGGYVTQVIDSEGNPHLAYCDSGLGNVKYARWDGSSWQIEVVDSNGDVGLYMSFTLDADDHAHIAYYKNLGTNDGNLKYAHWDGTSWNIETVDDGQDTGTDTSIDTDSNGYPHISYVDNNNAILKYAKWDGADWQLEIVDNGNYVGFYNALVLDEDDHAHICYRDNAIGILRYAEWDGADWQLEIIDNDAVEKVGAFASIVLDDAGYTHISYYDWPDKLRYASWNGTSWDIQYVGLGGRSTSLVLDENGYPHISHSEYATTSAKYSFWDGTSWQTETVDGTNSNVGYATSLVLDEYSSPFIAYQDLENHDLKYASLMVNMPPSGFGLINPADESQQESTTVNFQWEASVDPEGNDLEYTLHLYNSESDTLIPHIYYTTFIFDGAEFFLNNTEYFWTISVSDGEHTVDADDTFTFTTMLGVGIENLTDNLDKGFVLSQNYPNPFSNQTNIQVLFSNESLLSKNKKLLVHDSKGKEVYSKDFSAFRTLNSYYSIIIEINDLNSGAYFYSLFIDNKLVDRKSMLLIKE